MITFVTKTEGWVKSFTENGFVVIECNGRSVLLVHASPKGWLRGGLDVAMAAVKCDAIACCYPNRVKKNNPELANKILGNWDCKTWVRTDDYSRITLSSK